MRIFALLFSLWLTHSVGAQQVFVAPMLELSEANNIVRLGYGIGGGFHINRWVAGAYGMYFPKNMADDRQMELTFGGGWIAYQQPASNALTVNIGLKGGFGNVEDQFDGATEDDRIWMFSPEAGVELSLGSYVRLGYSAGYRIVGDLQLSDLQNKDLYSLVNTFVIKIGKFRR